MFAKQLLDKNNLQNYLIKKCLQKKLFDKDSIKNSQNSVTKQMEPRKNIQNI